MNNILTILTNDILIRITVAMTTVYNRVSTITQLLSLPVKEVGILKHETKIYKVTLKILFKIFDYVYKQLAYRQ